MGDSDEGIKKNNFALYFIIMFLVMIGLTEGVMLISILTEPIAAVGFTVLKIDHHGELVSDTEESFYWLTVNCVEINSYYLDVHVCKSLNEIDFNGKTTKIGEIYVWEQQGPLYNYWIETDVHGLDLTRRSAERIYTSIDQMVSKGWFIVW